MRKMYEGKEENRRRKVLSLYASYNCTWASTLMMYHDQYYYTFGSSYYACSYNILYKAEINVYRNKVIFRREVVFHLA